MATVTVSKSSIKVSTALSATGSITGGTSATVYTVPADSYIIFYAFDANSIGSGTNRMTVNSVILKTTTTADTVATGFYYAGPGHVVGYNNSGGSGGSATLTIVGTVFTNS